MKPKYRLRYGPFSPDHTGSFSRGMWPNLSKPVVAVQERTLFGYKDIKKFLAYVPIYGWGRTREEAIAYMETLQR